MSKIIWDKTGERFYQTGLDRGVFYPIVDYEYTNGVAWNGLISVSDNSDAEFTPLYTGNRKSGSEKGSDELTGKLSAYTFPKEFDRCLGSFELIPGMYVHQQNRSRFGLSYRTLVGNDTDGPDYGYKLHILYGLGITGMNPDDNSTRAADLSPQKLTFDFDSIPEELKDFEPVSHIVFESTLFDPNDLKILENILYGDEYNAPRLPFPSELAELFDHGYVEEYEYDGYPHPRLYPETTIYPEGGNDNA